MARKNDLVKTKYKGIYKSDDEYFVTFSVKGHRYAEKNITKLFGIRTLTQAVDKLAKLKLLAQDGKDPFGLRKTETLDNMVSEYLETCSVSHCRKMTGSYQKHVSKDLGHLMINKITRTDIQKIIYKMENQGYKYGTIKKVIQVLKKVFSTALIDRKIEYSPTVKLEYKNTTSKKIPMEVRIDEPIVDVVKKMYLAIQEEPFIENRIFMLFSLMSARRQSEIHSLKFSDIDFDKDMVLARKETTKTNIEEYYPLAPEIKELLLALKSEKQGDEIFRYQLRKYSDDYLDMVEKKATFKRGKRYSEQPIRTHDNRNFLISICSKKWGRDLIGSLVLSHSDKSDMNQVYFENEYGDKIQIMNYYWNILRGREVKVINHQTELYSDGSLKSEAIDDKITGYYQDGYLQYEVTLKDGKAVGGLMYNLDGDEKKMTNAHFHKFGIAY